MLSKLNFRFHWAMPMENTKKTWLRPKLLVVDRHGGSWHFDTHKSTHRHSQMLCKYNSTMLYFPISVPTFSSFTNTRTEDPQKERLIVDTQMILTNTVPRHGSAKCNDKSSRFIRKIGPPNLFPCNLSKCIPWFPQHLPKHIPKRTQLNTSKALSKLSRHQLKEKQQVATFPWVVL